jgi:hypothetical protein
LNWNWKVSFRKNFYKILIHEAIEIAWLASWVISLESSLLGWVIGIGGSIAIHMGIFHGVDFLHEHHHHHETKCGHGDHKDINSGSHP